MMLAEFTNSAGKKYCINPTAIVSLFVDPNDNKAKLKLISLDESGHQETIGLTESYDDARGRINAAMKAH